jgi:hypothetical protein
VATSATAETAPRQRARRGVPRQPRPMSMPYDPQAPIAVVQPPAHLAHLTGAALYEALIADRTERWYSARFRAEVGRSEGRFKAWMVNHYKVKNGTNPATIDDRVMVEPDGYEVRSPWWYAGTARKWAIEEGLMRRDGVLEPYRPSGRPRGATDSTPRTRTATMRAGALVVLDECEKLTAGGAMTLGAARAQLAARYGLTEKQIARRLTAGREMRAAGIRPLTDDMHPDQRWGIIDAAFRLLMTDGRRKNATAALVEAATRVGATEDEVQAATRFGQTHADAGAAMPPVAPAETPRDYEAEDQRAQLEAAIVVDSIARGTAPLHPEA